MLSIITSNPIPFILAIIIGLATAWWIWASSSDADADSDAASDADADADTGTPPEPVVAPAAAADLTPEPAIEEAEEPDLDTVPVPLAVADLDADKPESDKPKIAAAVGEPDDLTQIKGIGPQLNDLCNALGVSRFDQIAAWSSDDVAEVDQYLKIKGRIDRDDWVGQAKLLCGMPADGKPNIAAAVGEPDDLTQIKGIGPKLNDLCHSLGVMRFDQIAQWSAKDVAEVDQFLKIKGRIDRDDWVGQAKKLAKG